MIKIIRLMKIQLNLLHGHLETWDSQELNTGSQISSIYCGKKMTQSILKSNAERGIFHNQKMNNLVIVFN